MNKLCSKKIMFVFIFLIIVLLVVVKFIPNYDQKKKILENNKSNNYIINSSAITMMYETEAGSGKYQTTTDTSWPQEGYVFNERLSGCENGGTISWNDATQKVEMKTNISDKCYVYFDVKKPILFADYIINEVYVSDGVNGLYYHDGVGTYTNASQEAGDNSYRYSGANPNNYICFGSDADICPEDSLYRIIGIFENKVKIIKENKYSDNYWSGSTVNESNSWANSNLNLEILNGSYLSDLGSWANKIISTNWNVGGTHYTDLVNSSKIVFDYELGKNSVNSPYNAKIGLIYISDYGYAAYSDAWTAKLTSYDSNEIKSNNWLYNSEYQWTITPSLDYTYYAFDINVDGYINNGRVYTLSIPVRPTFYLNYGVSYISGTGTKTNPYRIN